MIRFDVLTLFPGMFAGPMDESILRRAREAGLIEVALHDLRSWAIDKHRTVDDYPFGGGAGMVLRVDVLAAAVDFAETLQDTHHLRVRVIRYQAAAVEVVQEAAVAAAMLMLMAWRAALIQVVVAVVAGREQAVTAGLE